MPNFSSVFQRGKSSLRTGVQHENGFTKAPEGGLFPKVNSNVDGEDCDHDCESCEIKYPLKWKVDEDTELYGHVNGWATHMLVATGKTDWVRDVADEKGSVMEAVRDCKVEPTNGKLMLSASNMALPSRDSSTDPSTTPITILLLPSFTLIDNVTPASVPQLITHHISSAPTTTTPLLPPTSSSANPSPPGSSTPSPSPSLTPPLHEASHFTSRPCPHIALILLCSQRTRDARCGQSAPLLRREFERHLRPLGLYRDIHDERRGGVGIYFISHVGGHKFAANVMVYRRTGPLDRPSKGEKTDGKRIEMEMTNGEKKNGRDQEAPGEASQGIWLARVRPEDCEGIVKFTVLKGKVVKPERQLRGGFNRERGLVSW